MIDGKRNAVFHAIAQRDVNAAVAFRRATQIADRYRAQAPDVTKRVNAQLMTKSADGKTGELLVYSFIGASFWGGGISAQDVVDALAELKGVDELVVRINSEGGDVFDGKAIYNAIRRFDGKKTVHIDGLCASIATVIAMAGDRIITAKNATWMVHKPWTLTMGDDADHEKTRGVLEKEGRSIAETYADRTKVSVDEALQLMADETWMNASEALSYGFTDEIDPAGDDEEEEAPKKAAALVVPRIAARVRAPAPNRSGLPERQRAAVDPAARPTRVTPGASMEPTATLDALNARLVELSDEANVIQNQADADKRDLSNDEVEKLTKLRATYGAVEEQISAREAAAEMKAKLAVPQRRATQPSDLDRPEASGRPRIEGGMPSGATKGSWGFRSMGEWAIACAKFSQGHHDTRIVNAPASYGSEGTNADGGYAVPPDFRENIVKMLEGEESLMAMTDQMVSSSNRVTMPVDNTTPWQTSGGIQVDWTAEAGDKPLSKPAIGQISTTLSKIAAVVPLTDELLEDVPAMTKYLNTKVPEKITSFLNACIINGDGSGKPLGILQSPAKVTVAAESGQGAGTVVLKNILKMWGRMYAPWRRTAVWIINQDLEVLLQQLVMPGTSPSAPAWMPPGGLSGAPYATLLGRPIIPVEGAMAAGTEGDITLWSPKQYLTVLKAGGMKTDVSIHLYFQQDITAFRFVLRVGGQPYLQAPIARLNGSNTLSSIVTLNGTRT